MAGTATGKQLVALQRPFFAKFKKHECARCGNRLHLIKITQRIEKGSPESLGKAIRFKIINPHPVNYTFSIFECPSCGNKLSISDQYFLENPHKKDKRVYDDYHQYLQSLDRQNGTNQYAEYVKNLEMQNKQKTRNR